MASIRLENLHKQFGAVEAVKGISLEIPDKSFAALLGPSGCGKTTTMRMIAGLENPTSGEIYFNDGCVNRVPAGERGVGFVFQNYAIFTNMTVYDNVAFGLKVRKAGKIETQREVTKVAELLQLSDILGRNAGRLSVNDMQKVALARSIITRPSIFLLDEPFSNLDASFRTYMRGELKRLQREIGQTMVYVTHDQIEAMSMADNIAVMDFGVLQQFGTPEEIYNQPTNTFVAGFIGSPNMNFASCSYQVEDGTGFLVQERSNARVAVDEKRRRILEQRPDNSDLILGIRPEHICVHPHPTSDDLWEAAVYVVEPLGPKTIVHVKVGETVVRVAALADYHPAIGDTQWLELNTDYMHIFDAQTGQVIR